MAARVLDEINALIAGGAQLKPSYYEITYGLFRCTIDLTHNGVNYRYDVCINRDRMLTVDKTVHETMREHIDVIDVDLVSALARIVAGTIQA
jgi:hypothetical protein